MRTDALKLISTSDKIEKSIRDEMYICIEGAEHYIFASLRITLKFAKCFLIYKEILIDGPTTIKIEFSKNKSKKKANRNLLFQLILF